MLQRKKKQPQTRRRTSDAAPKATVFSYYNNRSSNEEVNSRASKSSSIPKISRHWLAVLPSFIAAFVILGSIGYATGLDSRPKIRILSHGDKRLLRDTAIYQQGASGILKQSILNRNKLTIDSKRVEDYIAAQYPEFSRVTMIIPLISRRPIIEVQPAEVVLALKGTGDSFVVDSQGRALISSKDSNTELLSGLPQVTDQSELEIKEGKQVLPLNTVRFIKEIIVQHAAKGISLKDITLPPIANELHVRTEGQDYFIKYNLQSNAREATGTFFAVSDKLSKEGVTPAEYIDVRVSEKVFYK